MTPSLILLGDKSLSDNSLFLNNVRLSFGLPKQKPYVLMTGFANMPQPIASLFTPTMPVIEPPNGSNADGSAVVGERPQALAADQRSSAVHRGAVPRARRRQRRPGFLRHVPVD